MYFSLPPSFHPHHPFLFLSKSIALSLICFRFLLRSKIREERGEKNIYNREMRNLIIHYNSKYIFSLNKSYFS